MVRPMISLLLAVAVMGCKGQDAQVPMDPFYGQTKIAPPATGEIGQRPTADPYYSRSSNPSGGTAAPSAMAGNGAAAGDSQEPPAGGVASSRSAPSEREQATAPNGDRIEIPVSARRELSASEILAARSSDNSPSGSRSADAAPSAAASPEPSREPETFVQTLSPRDPSLVGEPRRHSRRTSEGGRSGTGRRAVDINDLPPANRGARSVRDDRVQQASAVESGDGVNVRIPSRVDDEAPRGRFGWAEDYSRLRGRLEYLERDRRWKLRYIPIDRKTDQYGGSVVIEDSQRLSGFERGDFVEVQGRVSEQPDGGKDYAPLYEVASIRSLDR